jgi:hypothetical protein
MVTSTSNIPSSVKAPAIELSGMLRHEVGEYVGELPAQVFRMVG